MLVLTILSVKDALTTGISSGRLPALAENISIDDAKVKRDLLRDSCKPPAISVQETYHFLLRLMKRERERERENEYKRSFKGFRASWQACCFYMVYLCAGLLGTTFYSIVNTYLTIPFLKEVEKSIIQSYIQLTFLI